MTPTLGQEVHEMNGTPMRPIARSVQLAVLAAPSTSVEEAAAEARRRHVTTGAWIATNVSPARRRLLVGAAA